MRYDWTVEVDGDDISQWVKAAGTIDYGRPTRNTGFQAPTAVFEVFTKDENPQPAPAVWPDIRIGSVVIIHATWDGFTQSRRFSGIVQALDWGLYGLRVTATGALVDGPDAPSSPPYPAAVDWQTRWAGGTGPIADYPAAADQTETDRVRWLVEDQAGFPVEVEGVPARRVRAVPVNSLGQPVLDAVLRVADDCDALLLQDRLGVMRYRTKNFTRPARVVLPAHLVESTSIDLAFERGSIINQVTVYYGEPDSTGNQPAVSDQDSASIIEFGERRAEMYTDIQYAGGAAGKAADYLTKNAPGWEAPDVTLLMNQASGAEADAIWDLQENWRVTISPLPAGCPIGSYDGDILGFTEVMHETDYRLILHLAPPFGDENAPPEEPIFAQDSITGGTTRTYEDQYGFLWQSHTWDTPGTATFTVNEPVTVEALVVAGGGHGDGGNLSNEGGGGGAGAVFDGELPYTPGTVAVSVGDAMQDTKLGDVWCYAGGRGGYATMPGLPGGFGGGGGAPVKPGGAGTYGSLDGGITTDTVRIIGGPGSTAGVTGSGDGGGASLVSSIVDGTAVTYAKPGRGVTGSNGGHRGDTPGSGGEGGGDLNGGAGVGAAGIVAVRYRIG